MSEQEQFLDKNNKIAVIGVSRDPEKWGWKIYKSLKFAGFEVYSVNPKYKMIGQGICYPNLKALPERPDVVITIVPPAETEKIVRECKELGIGKVWMQPGSESEDAITFCKDSNINVIHNACFVLGGLKQDLNSGQSTIS